MKFNGEVAWITGSGSGIGRACAVAFAAAGARVALTGRRVEALEQTAALIRDAGGSALVVPADVADRAAVEQAHRAVVMGLGDPLVLVNSAGGNVTQRHWKNLEMASASDVIDMDLKTHFYCTLAVLPAMRARRDGRIVHIASQAAVSLQTVSGPSYSAAKHGVLGMSASLNAEEGINGVRSICISPGEVETPILNTRPQPPTEEERRLMLQPEDVANAALFCATIPARACVTELVLLPTDDRHVRDRAQAIDAMTTAVIVEFPV
jgi:NADP-dependent 3-hydroxy acid dehydrogenase YdfG